MSRNFIQQGRYTSNTPLPFYVESVQEKNTKAAAMFTKSKGLRSENVANMRQMARVNGNQLSYMYSRQEAGGNGGRQSAACQYNWKKVNFPRKIAESRHSTAHKCFDAARSDWASPIQG